VPGEPRPHVKGASASGSVMGCSSAKGRRGSAAVSIPDHLLRRGTPLFSAKTGNPGTFRRHRNQGSFGVARGACYETFAPSISASGSGCCRSPCHLKGREGANPYPTRPVRVIVGFPPGGPSDILARLIGQWLSKRLGQPFIIENRPGATGNIATEAVTRASADGHTLLLVVPANAISVALYDNLKLNFNFIRDTTPVAGISIGPLVMEVNLAIPVNTVPEFIAYAKANPGKINFASPGNGAVIHLCGELFKMMTGVNMVHVPYRGNAPALTDLLAGQVQVMFADTPSSIEHIRAGKLRALAVTTARRPEVLPEIPTVSEFVPGFEASNWFGVAAPKNTPPEIIDKLNKEINAALAEPKIKARLADLGAAALAGSPIDFGKLITEEAEKWGKVVKFAGIKTD
jgi:tripartite-type tricarboxylate transporter receptor subunit TctC